MSWDLQLESEVVLDLSAVPDSLGFCTGKPMAEETNTASDWPNKKEQGGRPRSSPSSTNPGMWSDFP